MCPGRVAKQLRPLAYPLKDANFGVLRLVVGWPGGWKRIHADFQNELVGLLLSQKGLEINQVDGLNSLHNFLLRNNGLVKESL
jgi:hypothetical protein